MVQINGIVRGLVFRYLIISCLETLLIAPLLRRRAGSNLSATLLILLGRMA